MKWGYWWWHEIDRDFVVEEFPDVRSYKWRKSDPDSDPWVKYTDPSTGNNYWYQNDRKWFWDLPKQSRFRWYSRYLAVT